MGYSSRDRTDSIPTHRVAVLRPFAQFLADAGAPVESGFRRARLPVYALENVNNYVPSHRFWAFLVDMAHREGIADLGFRVGQAFGANSADPHLTDLLRRSPTLYRGLLAASELTNRTITHCRLGLLQPLDSDYTYFFHSPSCDAHNPAIEQIGWFGLMTLIGMVRAFTGPGWYPTEIGMMTNRAPGLYIRQQFWATRIRLSQPYSYLALENRLLSLPPLSPEAAVPVSASRPYEAMSQEFSGSLRQVLQSYIQESDLSIDFAAGLCETSKRSLQRKLKATGTCYSEVRDQARLDVAKWMLRDPGVKIIDVAQRLGYSNATHFARAFRRITGVNPRDYRQQTVSGRHKPCH